MAPLKRGAEGQRDGEIVDADEFNQSMLAQNLLRETDKARVYTAILVEGPVTHTELTDRIGGMGETKVWQCLKGLRTSNHVHVDDETQPYEYTADPVNAGIYMDGKDPTLFEVTPTFIALISARAVRGDIDLFLERHSIGKLAAAYEATIAYLNEEVTLRLAAEKAGLDNYEGMTIIDEIESVIEQMRDADPHLGRKLDVDDGGDENDVGAE